MLDKEQRGKINIVLIILAFICWIIMAVTTIIGIPIVYDWICVFVGVFSGTAILLKMRYAGRYKGVSLCYGLGCFVWAFADILWALNVHAGLGDEVFEKIVDNMYLIPDYIFLIALVVYAREIFSKNITDKLFVNAFIISVITIVFGYRFASDYHNLGNGISVELVELLLYFFVSVFMIIVLALIFFKTGFNHSKALYMVVIPMFLFCVAEIRYTYYMVIDKDPENIFIDIAYMLFLVIYAVALSRDDIANAEVREKITSKKRSGYIYWINSAFLIGVPLVLYLVGYFTSYMLFFMIVATLGYIIMCKTVQANELSEELLERQRSETARLEKMVEDKTRELREMNEHLEHISNTDALTGLYNRRYGMDLLADLVKKGESYPIALYSLDLNYFKPINDNYGHDMGDVVLKEVGRRLHRLGQERCTAIRIGGDEFLIVFRNATNDLAVRGIGDLICEKMDEPIDATVITEEGERLSHSFQISASMGVAIIPNDTNDIEELYKLADDALYAVKHTSEKSSYLLYKEMDSFLEERK